MPRFYDLRFAVPFGVLVLLLAVRAADAAPCTWDGSSGPWNDAVRWSCGHTPGAADDVTISNGSVSFDVDATVASFTLDGGTLAGAGDLTIGGALTWRAGTMGGAGTTRVNGATLFTGAVSKTIGRRIVLAGDATWDNGNINMSDGSVLRLLAGRTFTDSAVGSHAISRVSIVSTEPVVENEGTWVVDGASGTGTNAQFHNAGTLVVTSPGGFDVSAPGTLENTGTLRGTTLVDLASGAVFVNSGTTAPGASGANPARFPFRGDFPMAPAHDLAVDVDGTGPAGTATTSSPSRTAT